MLSDLYNIVAQRQYSLNTNPRTLCSVAAPACCMYRQTSRWLAN